MSIKATLHDYYQLLNRKEQDQYRIQNANDQIGRLRKLLKDDDMFRSQGVARYSADTHGSGTPGDPTGSAAEAHMKLVEETEASITSWELDKSRWEQDIARIDNVIRGVFAAVNALDEDHRFIIEKRYRERWMFMQIGEKMDIEERTVRRWHDRALNDLTGAILLYDSAEICLPAVNGMTKRCQKNGSESGQNRLEL